MKGKLLFSSSVYLGVLSFCTANAIAIVIRNNSWSIGSRSYSTPKKTESNWKLSPMSAQVSPEPYSYVNSYLPSSYYNLSRQDDNDNGFGFDNGGNGGFGIGGTGGGFGATGGVGSGGGGLEALGVGGGIIAAIGLAILAIFVIPLILLLLLGLLILPFSPLLLLLLLLLIPETQKKIVFGEPPGNGIFPRSFRMGDYFVSNFESIFKMILQAIESQEFPCSDDISCQNPIKNEIGARRENPTSSSSENPTTPNNKELPEWKKVLRAAIQQTQAFTQQVVKRINNMKNNVSKISSSAAASAISKIANISS